MTLPLWLLDVDGVLNAMTRRPTKSWTDYRTVQVQVRPEGYVNRTSYPITYSPSLVSFLNQAHGHLIEIQWLTSWGSQANEDLADQLGFAHRFTVAAEPPLSHTGWWKWPVATQAVEADPERKLVWTDDDLVWSSEAKRWARAHRDTVLALPPYANRGLSPANLDRILQFLTGSDQVR